jgi:hypothetical protein
MRLIETVAFASGDMTRSRWSRVARTLKPIFPGLFTLRYASLAIVAILRLTRCHGAPQTVFGSSVRVALLRGAMDRLRADARSSDVEASGQFTIHPSPS